MFQTNMKYACAVCVILCSFLALVGKLLHVIMNVSLCLNIDCCWVKIQWQKTGSPQDTLCLVKGNEYKCKRVWFFYCSKFFVFKWPVWLIQW